MPNKYNSVFESIYQYVKGSSMAAWVFVLAIITLMIGINGFAEDTYSSYVGIQMIEKTFSVKPASWELTYWMMSLSFQVLTVIAFFAYLSDKKNNWWGFWLALGAQAVDFASDVWYRSNGTYTSAASVVVSLFFTFLFFTIGSEVALTFGLGLVAKLFVEGMSQLAIFVRNVFTGLGQMGKILASGVAGDTGATDSSVTHQTKDIRFSPQQLPPNFQNVQGPKPSMPPQNKPDQYHPPMVVTEEKLVMPPSFHPGNNGDARNNNRGNNNGGGKPPHPGNQGQGGKGEMR